MLRRALHLWCLQGLWVSGFHVHTHHLGILRCRCEFLKSGGSLRVCIEHRDLKEILSTTSLVAVSRSPSPPHPLLQQPYQSLSMFHLRYIQPIFQCVCYSILTGTADIQITSPLRRRSEHPVTSFQMFPGAFHRIHTILYSHHM